MTRQIVILQTMFPVPDDELSNCEWLVQWNTEEGSTASKWFEFFEDASRFIESELL